MAWKRRAPTVANGRGSGNFVKRAADNPDDTSRIDPLQEFDDDSPPQLIGNWITPNEATARALHDVWWRQCRHYGTRLPAEAMSS